MQYFYEMKYTETKCRAVRLDVDPPLFFAIPCARPADLLIDASVFCRVSPMRILSLVELITARLIK